jgi:hypothetical protein
MSQDLSGDPLHQLEAVAEGVEDVDAAEAVEGGVLFCRDAGTLAGRKDGLETVDDERRMSPLGGGEIGLDAEMKIHGASDKPDALAGSHLRWLIDFGEAEYAGVEGARAIFAAHGNNNLHMVEAEDWHWWKARLLPLRDAAESCE